MLEYKELVIAFIFRVLVRGIYEVYQIGGEKALIKGMYFILAKIIRYRSKVIDRNLKQVLPNHSKEQILKLKSDYYYHFSELTIESLWSYRAKSKEILAKVHLKSQDIMDEITKSQENVTLLISHIGNWELFCQWASVYFPNTNIVILYTPIKNKSLNDLIIKYRERYGAYMVSTKSTLDLFRMQKRLHPCVNLFAIDQNPGDPYSQHWLDFFGKSVPVISGAEKFVKSQNQKVYYLKVTKPQNYELELIELDYDRAEDYDLTEKQFELLEENILENPALWLLSHNRFKYSK